MKALLIKDIITIWKQMKLMLALILVFSVVSSDYQNIFAVVYASLIPYIAIAYDEKSKWNRMAAMMPYSVRDIVWSKYLLGIIFSAGALILALAIRFTVSSVRSEVFEASLLILGFIGAMLIMDISLPLMFRFGVEKGRLLMFLIIFLVCGSAAGLDAAASIVSSIKLIPLCAVALVLSVVLNFISVQISFKWYRSRL